MKLAVKSAWVAVVAAALGASGCAASRPAQTPDAKPNAMVGVNSAQPIAGEIGELPPRSLPDDQCSIVLWTRALPSRRVLVTHHNPARAYVQIAGRTRDLPRISSSGAAVLGQAETQVYDAGKEAQLSLDVRFELAGNGQPGAAIRSGSLGYTGADGATLVIPVIGLASCGPGARR